MQKKLRLLEEPEKSKRVDCLGTTATDLPFFRIFGRHPARRLGNFKELTEEVRASFSVIDLCHLFLGGALFLAEEDEPAGKV